MKPDLGLDHCLSFINSQLASRHRIGNGWANRRYRAVTLSRQSGSGAHQVASGVAELLQQHNGLGAAPWTVFDRDLVEHVLEEHHLPKRLARFMPEDRISEIADTMDELFGLHPSSWTLVRQTAETILHLVELGNVIIIGRGANVVTSRHNDVLHVRLIGSLEHRVKWLQDHEQLSQSTARELALKEEGGRRRFLKKYFNKDIDDPLLYHLVINTDLLPPDEAAELIAQAVLAGKQDKVPVNELQARA